MNQVQILQKAIEKAMANGYKDRNFKAFKVLVRGEVFYYGYDLILDHEFAKALWEGDKEYPVYLTAKGKVGMWARKPAWEWHLQNMVIADDPIAYLGENL